jgi:riboflavin synthase
VEDNGFGVNIIPHTAEHTTFGDLQPGQKVNLEVDIISRYLERLMGNSSPESEAPAVTLAQLVRCGFADMSTPDNK